MPVFPDDPSVTLEPARTLEDDGYRVSALACSSHTGTHIDAPSHTEPAGRTIDAYPLEAFVFDARIVDCTGKEPRAPITAEELPAVADGVDLIVCRTGWDRHWGTATYADHPYLTAQAAERCVEAGLSIGVDTLNPDPTPTPNASADEPTDFPVHAAVLGADHFIIENLTNLEGLDRVTLYAFPLALTDGDGSPVRAVAQIDDRYC